MLPLVRQLYQRQPEAVMRLRAFPKSLERELAEAWHQAGIPMSPQGYTHLVCVMAPCPESAVYYAMQARADTMPLTLPPHQGEAKAVCRAFHKLEEACKVLQDGGLALDEAGMRVVDVGAAPGGWTSYMARHHGCKVVAPLFNKKNPKFLKPECKYTSNPKVPNPDPI